MKTNSSQKIRLGIFVLAGILLLIAGVFLIGKKKSMFTDTYAIYGTFKNVSGLQIGNNIRFAGINVGTVENISIINDTTIRVDMRMQSKVKPFLKADAMASIGSDGLMGDKLITINPGTNNVKLLNNGDRIVTANPVEIDRIVAKLANVADNAEVLSYALANIATQVSDGKGSLGRLLYKDDLAVGLESTVSTAQQTMQSIKQGSENFGENMNAMKGTFLLRGYYKKKERKLIKQHIADSIKNASKVIDTSKKKK